MADRDSILGKLREYGKSGMYREAIRDYIANEHNASYEDHLIDVQYAVALQHAGLFNEALGIYRLVIEAASNRRDLFEGGEIAVVDLVYNLRLQEAVLLERLREVDQALYILDEIGPPGSRQDLEIAIATLPSWYLLTRLKCHMQKGELDEVGRCVTECQRLEEAHPLLRNWGRVYGALAKIEEAGSVTTKQFSEIRSLIGEVASFDSPGQPWLGLEAGRHVLPHDAAVALEILDEAAKQSSFLGKFYVLAACSELQARCHRELGSPVYLLEFAVSRAISAYAKCQVLVRPPIFRQQLYRFCVEKCGWDKDPVLDMFLRASGFLIPREEIVFSRMCLRLGKKTNRKPDEVFEDFVGDWSTIRFCGRRAGEPTGQPTADTVIVREENGQRIGTVVQAKHYRNPRKAIPSNLYLREIATAHGLERIEKYVFVVSTSDPDGWGRRMWHHEDERKIRNLVPSRDIEVVVVTEPELQTDVALSESLYFRYFNPIDGFLV